jgi:hypothetical protein
MDKQRYSDRKKRRIKRKQNQQHRKTTKSYFEYICELLNDDNGVYLEDIDFNPPIRNYLKYQE